MANNNGNFTPGVAIGFGVVGLVGILVAFAVFQLIRMSRGVRGPNPPDTTKMCVLEQYAPVSTMGEWWTKNKGTILPCGGTEGQIACVICLDSVLYDHKIRELKCLHVFHQECLDKWFLKGKNQCPLCNQVFYTIVVPPAAAATPNEDWRGAGMIV